MFNSKPLHSKIHTKMLILSLIFSLLANAVVIKRENKIFILIIFIVLLYYAIVEYGCIATVFLGSGINILKELFTTIIHNHLLILFLLVSLSDFN